MRDAKLWKEIEAAPTALATVEYGLEFAIVNRLRVEFQLTANRCASVLLEYRRFRYLGKLSDPPLRAPPLIAFIQVWDTANAFVVSKGKIQLSRSIWVGDFNSSYFGRDPAYQRTLDLYRQEFGLEPQPKIWPSPLFLRRRDLAWMALFAAFGLAYVGDWLGGEWVMGVGAALALISIVYLLLHTHWADRAGD